MSVTAGEWATLVSTSPSFTGGFGVTISSGVTFWMQIAPVRLANVQQTGDTVPVWQDVSDYVAEVQCDVGTQDGSESRWPPGTATVIMRDLDTVLDFITTSSPDTRFSAGSLIRWGLRTSAHGWEPHFTGYIDKIDEDEIPGFGTTTRVQILRCVDTTYFLAGINDAGVAPNTFSAGTTFNTIISNHLDANLWPFNKTIGATTMQLIANTSVPGNQLQWAHRFADSYGQRFYADSGGQAVVAAWGPFPTALQYTLSDMPDKVVSGHTNLTNGVPALAHWSTSPERAVGFVVANYATGLTYISSLTNARLQRKWQNRYDPVGWPKLDLLTSTNADIQTLVDDAATRLGDELYLDRLSVDTLSPAHSSRVWNLLIPSSGTPPRLGMTGTYQRRRYGSSGWIARDVMIVGLSWLINPSPGRVRLTMHTKDPG